MAGVSFTTLEIESFNVRSIERQAEVIIGQYNVYPILDNMKGAAPDEDGGDVFTMPVEFVDHSEPTELVTGYEQPDMNVQTTLNQYLQYQWWFAAYPITISKIEQLKYKGGDNLINIQADRVANVQRACMRKMETHLAQGGVPQHSRLVTFNGIDYAAGLLEAAATTAQTHSVGGLAKSSYSQYPLLLNQYYDINGSVNARGFDGLAQVDAYISTRAPDAQSMGFHVCSELSRAAFARLANARVFTTEIKDSQEINPPHRLMVNGVEMRTSPFMPLAGTTSATTKGSVYRLHAKDQPLTFMKGAHWDLQGWVQHPTQLTLNNFLLVGAQVMTKRLASAALFTNAESYS